MPAILVEVGFLSNPSDAARLADRSFHSRTARALASAIRDFRARMEAVREESP
jgi:N-acetylmuramoyl-L-alanine amidase